MKPRFPCRKVGRTGAIAALASIALLALSMLLLITARDVVASPAPVFGPACGMAVIDGHIDPAEWSGAPAIPATFVSTGSAAPLAATIRVMNGARYLYLGMSIADDELSLVGQYLVGGDQFRIDFDNDHGGALFAVGDDVVSVKAAPPRFEDSHVDGDPSPTSAGDDVEAGGTDDGSGAASRQGGMNHYEVRHPLCSGDALDFCLKPGDVVGVRFEYLDAEGDGSYGGSRFFPGNLDTSIADIRVGACPSIADLDLYLPRLLRSP